MYGVRFASISPRQALFSHPSASSAGLVAPLCRVLAQCSVIPDRGTWLVDHRVADADALAFRELYTLDNTVQVPCNKHSDRDWHTSLRSMRSDIFIRKSFP